MIRIIIDAYNLIFQCGLQPKSLNSPLALHRTRVRLIEELLDRVADSDRSDTLLVFDAKNPRGMTTPDLVGHGFKIAFARDYEDADAMVIELIQKHSQPKQLTVVSSDHRIQTAASRREASFIDSDVWFDRPMGSASPASRNNAAPILQKPDISLSDKETQALIDEFSQFDPESTGDKPKNLDEDVSHETFNPFPKGYGEDLLDDL
jgi:predicted RNA-binding protein with PIN domain